MALKAVLLDSLLVAAVAATWLGVAGFARLRAPLDRLHCVSFVNVAAGTALAAAAFVNDGLSSRSLTVLIIVALSVLTGAATAHATGRAFMQRGAAE